MPLDKVRSKKRKLSDIAPSNAKWQTLRDHKIVKINFFDITKVTGVLDHIGKVKSLCVPPVNEGYPVMVWTII